jgi:hypothetical protein
LLIRVSTPRKRGKREMFMVEHGNAVRAKGGASLYRLDGGDR